MSFNFIASFLILPLTLWYINRLAYVAGITCDTEHCHNFAQQIITSMNVSVDPCTDFYEYACGSWEIHHPLPKGELHWSADDLINESVLKKIQSIVNETLKSSDIAPIKKMKKFFQSCMDTEKLEERGIASLINIIDRTGGWPMAMLEATWDQNATAWQEVDMAYSNIDGRNAFFSVLYTHDDVNLTRHVFLIDEAISYPLLKNNKDPDVDAEATLEGFVEFIAKTVKAIASYKNITIDHKIFTKDVLKVIELEFSLRDIIDQDKKREKKDMEKMTIRSLQEWYDSLPRANDTSNIDWLRLLQFSFSLINKTLSPDEPIIISSKDNLRKLSELLDRVSQRTIVNYIQWVFVNRYIAYTTKELREAKYEMYEKVFNIDFRIPRWKECIKQVGMQDAISYAFVKKYFSRRVKQEAKEMVDRIKQEIALGITRTHWTTASMKAHMIEKLNAIEQQVGYPEWYANETNIVAIYDELEVGDDFFQNILNYGKFTVTARVEQYFHPVDKDAWLEYPTTVNAFYSERDNIIVIPAAELQDPFFTPGLPDAINYGSIGFIIGHELSHGFDHVGINYDKHGNKVTAKVQALLDIYENKAECFVDQYNAFVHDHTDENGQPIPLNGNLTENENIADSTGIMMAYMAYKKKAEETEYKSLPNLQQFNDDQLFFLSFATSWCGVMHPTFGKSLINVDVHSPANFRIIGSLNNMDSFASAFNCSKGSPMNPNKKCTIWS